jgi:hypothetical protein
MQSEREYTERGRAARAETCKTQCLECREVQGQTVYYNAQGCDEQSINIPTLSPQPWGVGASIFPVAVPRVRLPLQDNAHPYDDIHCL